MKYTLIWLYFKRQSKRTVYTALILALGLIIILTSFQLINGFENEISGVIEDVNEENNTLLILDQSNSDFNNFTKSQLERLNQHLNRTNQLQNSLELFFTTKKVSNIYTSFTIPKNFIVNTYTTNLSKLMNLNVLDFTITPQTIDLPEITSFIGNGLRTELPENTTLTHNTDQILINKSYSFTSNLDFQQAIILNEMIFPKTTTNIILLKLSENTDFGELRDITKSLDLQVLTPSGNSVFLAEGASQVIQTLVLLQFAMSILIIISISNILLQLFDELKTDFRNLNEVGFSELYIAGFILGISLLIGTISAVIAVFASTLISTAIVSFLAVIGTNPFIVVELNWIEIQLVTFQSLIICTISAINPIWRVFHG